MFNPQEEDRQRELFEDFASLPKKKARCRIGLGKINFSLSHENVIIIFIGLVMTLLVCYSLGVEKGRRLARVEVNPATPQVSAETDVKPVKKATEPRPKKLRLELAETKQPPQEKSAYIQVASFRTDKYAQKEIQRLEHKGYRPFTLTWGKYKVVCVGRYDSKNAARQDLKQLKQMYADCILRDKQTD